MITLTQYNGKKIGVFGLGISGQATIAALLAGGAEVYAWDDNATNIEQAKAAQPNAHYENYAAWPWKAMDTLVLSPGVPLTHPQPHMIVTMATVRGCKITGDIELLQEACPDATYVGITGTNGKSTTTALTGHILQSAGKRVQVGGNLGTAALALEPLGEDGIYVIECSSYQLDLLSATTFDVAALINITPDHLDRHGGMEGYIAAKKNIFNGQNASDTAIIGVDDKHGAAIYRDMKEGKNRYTWQGKGAELVQVSVKRELKEGIYAKNATLFDPQASQSIDIGEVVSLRGSHNWQNAAIASAICKALGLSKTAIEKGLKSFGGLAHRMEFIAERDGVQAINDSKATNAEATANALRAYDDIYWILGGKPKDGGIDSLAEFFPKIKQAYLIGEAAQDFAKVLAASGVAHVISQTLENATKAAMADAQKAAHGVVLLSPACASFDQFKSFEHRGQMFGDTIRKILSTGGSNHGAQQAIPA